MSTISLKRLLVMLVAATAVLAMMPAQATEWMQVDRILVKKSARKLFLIQDGRVLDNFTVSLGGAPFGPKLREGDSRTPEGVYTIDWKNPYSAYFLSLHISYPNAQDIARAQAKGIHDPGGQIMIHGLPNGAELPADYYLSRDWTDGCIAVSNRAMRIIYAAVEAGTLIEIMP